MNEGLKIQVSADVQQATNALKNLNTNLAATQKATVNTASALPKLGQSSSQATFALTNFSRVVQDAPFGIIGIANNIDPLIQSFTALKASTGSTGAALKVLAGSLIGGGGLALAVSVVTSALSFFALRQRGVKKELNDAKSTTDSYVTSLTKQKVEFESLVKLAKDQAQSEETRVLAIKKLNDILPDTIGKLNQQNIATAEGARITREYIKAIEARATAELLINRISENNIKLFDNRNQVLLQNQNLEARILQLREKAEKLRQRGQLEAAFTVEAEISAAISEQNRLREKGRTEAQKLLDANQKLRNEYERILPTEIKLTEQSTKKTNAKKQELDAANAVIAAYRENNRVLEEEIKLTNQLINAGRNQLRTGGEGQAELRRLGGFADNTQNVADLSVLQNAQKGLNNQLQLTDQLIGSIANEFSDLFSSISKDGIKAFGDIAKAIAETTTKILIQVAVTQLLKQLLNSIAPGSGLAVDAGNIGGISANGISNFDVTNLRILGGG